MGGGMGMGGMGMGGNKGKGKGGKRRPSGPNLDRTRITEEPLEGEVVEWKGKFGWIKPAEPFEHEKANPRHEGKIFVSLKDLNGLESLDVGTYCQFQVFFDEAGIGAEEIVC